MKQKIQGFLIISFLIFSFSTTLAQTAKDIINKYIAKTGGIDKWNGLQTMVSTGTTSLMGQEFGFTLTSKSPNLNRMEVSVMGQSLVQAYDGKTAWTINPFQGSGKPEAMSPELGKIFSSQSQIRPSLLDMDVKGLKALLTGKEALNGVDCYKVEITHPEGDKEYYFFDASTNLLVMVRKTATNKAIQGKIAESYFSDYRDEQGVLLPHKTETKVDGQTYATNTIRSFKINGPVDSKIFDFPSGN